MENNEVRHGISKQDGTTRVYSAGTSPIKCKITFLSLSKHAREVFLVRGFGELFAKSRVSDHPVYCYYTHFTILQYLSTSSLMNPPVIPTILIHSDCPLTCQRTEMSKSSNRNNYSGTRFQTEIELLFRNGGSNENRTRCLSIQYIVLCNHVFRAKNPEFH